MKIRYLIIPVVLSFGLLFAPVVRAQSLEDKIREYEQIIQNLRGQKDSLSKQINLLNSQIALSEARIGVTEGQIVKLEKEISDLDTEIERLEEQKTKRLELVLHRIPESYKRSRGSAFGAIFLSKNFSEFLTRVKYLARVQAEDSRFYQELQLTQNNYNERRDVREEKKVQQESLKKQLEAEVRQRDNQKREKEVLLAQTQNDESRYQSLLAQARAQLAGFAKFSSFQGGGLVSGLTSCDGWGCYYNQRESQWGNTLINGSNDCGGPCTIARVGCLVTSVAMAASHLGRSDISPSDVATSGGSNFQVGTALLKKGTISVKGVNITRSSVGSLSPDAVSGGPVIVGLYYGEFGTHFVVVKSYQDGKYIMNDPYRSPGRDLVFTDYYSLGSVFSVERVSI